MNCIFLLLLLGCCGGRGNDCCCMPAGRNSCGNRRCGGSCERDCDMPKCDRPRHCHERRECDRREPGCTDPCRRQEECCCEEKRPCREAEGCGCAREERDGCDSPGMIPPPWQEYPKFPRRDCDADCEG